MTDEVGRGIDVRNSKNEDAELNIKGDSSSTLNVNAKNEAIYSAGDVNISGEGTIDATIDGESKVVAKATEDQGLDVDGDLTIKGGSLVDVLATGNYSSAIRSLNYANGGGGGHIYINDSVVKAIVRYAKGTSDAPNPYVSEIDPDEGDKDGRMNTGILAATNEGVKPAIISIVRSKVTAEGDTAAILAVVTSTDGKEMGTIEIKDASVLAPFDGKVIDCHAKNEHSVGDTTYTTYNDGQLIGTGDVTVSDLDDPAVAKSAVIGTEDEQKPTPKPDDEKPTPKPDEKPGQQPAGDDGQQNLKPATYKAPAATKPATATKNVPATGDASVAGAAATGLGGIAALLAGLVARRKRQ